jgi:3-hydroxyisobutyrate dehydrogenase-like beta-hydroxyacid dehydrogenase
MARLLVAHGSTVVACVQGRSQATQIAAEAAGITLVPTIDAMVTCADLVVSVVPQQAVMDSVAAFAGAVRRTSHCPLYVDANSVAPATLRDVCAEVAIAGAACVDGAFVGNASQLEGRTTLYLSGDHAERAATALSGALRVRVLDSEAGTASAFKLCLYGFNKGLVALFLEMVTAAESLGQRAELLASLRLFYPGTVETVERLLPTYPRNALRRVAELDEVVDWLRSAGHPGPMASGTRAVLRAFADLGLSAEGCWDTEDVVDECCRRHLLSGGL